MIHDFTLTILYRASYNYIQVHTDTDLLGLLYSSLNKLMQARSEPSSQGGSISEGVIHCVLCILSMRFLTCLPRVLDFGITLELRKHPSD